MIKSFRSKALRKFAATGDARKLPVQNADKVRRVLQALDRATRPEDMNLPGYKFHGLHGNPQRHSVWITGNYRLTFEFQAGDALNVDLEDYH